MEQGEFVMDDEMRRALEADGEKLRQLTGKEHGPFCPRCLINPIDKIFLGSEDEGHICGDCWVRDRHAEEVTMRAQRCVECGRYLADPPSRLCPGCEAYQGHQR
jgi:hypothetical protein